MKIIETTKQEMYSDATISRLHKYGELLESIEKMPFDKVLKLSLDSIPEKDSARHTIYYFNKMRNKPYRIHLRSSRDEQSIYIFKVKDSQ